jgi:hypothetical protein
MWNEDIRMNKQDLSDQLARGRFEATEDGLYLPDSKIIARGQFCYNKRGEPVEYSDNLLVDQGLNSLLGVALGNVTQISSWYIAIFSGDVTVLASWTAANFTSGATEITAYDETTRVAWTPTAAAGGIISSYTAKSTFTANSGITVRGAALISASAKSATSGTLMAASRFGADKALTDGEIIDIGYQVQLTAA